MKIIAANSGRMIALAIEERRFVAEMINELKRLRKLKVISSSKCRDAIGYVETHIHEFANEGMSTSEAVDLARARAS